MITVEDTLCIGLTIAMLIAVYLMHRKRTIVLNLVYATAYTMALKSTEDYTEDLAAIDRMVAHIRLSSGKFTRVRAIHSDDIKAMVKNYIDHCDLPRQKMILDYCASLDRQLLSGNKHALRYQLTPVRACSFLLALRQALYDGSYDRIYGR